TIPGWLHCTIPGLFRGPLLASAERLAEVVGERAERGARRRGLALGVLAQLRLLLLLRDGLLADADALARGVDVEDHGLDVAARREGLLESGVAVEAGLGVGHEGRPAGREEHEDAELLVPLDLAGDDRARDDVAAGRGGPARPGRRARASAG